MSAKTSAAAKNKWNRANYDRIELIVPKGKKEEIKAHADARRESVNGFVNRAINSQIERDKAGD